MPCHRSWYLAAILAVPLARATAQASDVALPKLSSLGPVPTPAVTLWLRADGTLCSETGDPLAAEAVRRILPAGGEAPALVLQIDASTPAGAVTGLLDTVRTSGLAQVHFVAQLPNGTRGCFTLVLPHLAQPSTNLDLRLHRERPGVPPSSATPLLQRLRAGLPAALATGFSLGIDAPTNAPWDAVLRTLAAVAEAGVARVVLTTSAPTAAAHPVGAFALDLGPVPTIQIPAQVTAQPKPALRDRAVGCLEAADNETPVQPQNGAGGRYGGRAGRANQGRFASLADAIAAGNQWWQRQQRPDGSFPDDQGRPDPIATALVTLALLGDGQTLDAGADTVALRASVGWLLGEQRENGAFADGGPGSLQQHSLATYALAEASGLSTSGALVRGAVQAAVGHLFAVRSVDGGWNDGTPGAASDTLSTVHGLTAVASAEFFAMRGPAGPRDLAPWFDSVASATGAHRLTAATPVDAAPHTAATAAALFARFFAGQDPKQLPVMKAAADLLLATSDPKDPWGSYWTTYALFQMGGRHWVEWSRRIDRDVVQAQIRDGELKGSWEPAGGCTRLTTTALRVLTLEAYYRYSRLVR